jgi:hypothetical protein
MNNSKNQYLKEKTHELISHDKMKFPHFYDKELLLSLSDDEQKVLKEERFEHKKKLANAFRMIKEIINLSHLD